ncbi:hypothetical protein LMH87_011831 [Akanthomyces muscarius]|uniref:Uncharacterized protein n=1 Tax=Akanthomyces muscarius TaxID=2231603 RepID=A0A9W8UL62_AKAMU|nr:hypothetical protein LMH87_011831 [Akanthomyces muscarius]KAJ4151114.1 hypothetical protein LMH87_011831 [Akanthomyces muscarius]
MVSFFGLRFGGDKKKGLAKSGDKKGQDNWKGIDQSGLPRGQFYGAPQHNEHLARPGTSYSTKGPTNWRQTFKGFGANSSMVDLSTPMRKESVSSLRHQPSEANFRNPWKNSSTANLPMLSALGGSGLRVGTPERPSTAGGRAKEWVNPLDVHFCKDPTGGPPSRSSNADGPAKSPLALHFGVDDDDDVAKSSTPAKDKTSLSKNDTTLNNGYPSPPQSVNNADQTLSPSLSDLSVAGKQNVDPSSLPSPAASAPRSSEDRWEAPVIRNVLAKRDTTTFHSPRRCSFTMDLEQQELERLRKQRQTEGFAGSFADFDFGEIITTQASIEQFPEPPSSGLNATPKAEPFPTFTENQSPTGKPDSSLTNAANTAPKRPERSPRNSQMDPTSMRSMNNSPELASTNFQLPVPAPVEAPRTAGARPATSYGRIGGPPAAAAGAHPGNDPVTTFEPPPRLGFRARLGSDASRRRKAQPPKPLKTSASQPALLQKSVSPSVQRDEPSPKSPFLPPSLSTNHLSSSEDTERSLDIKSPKSPYTKPTLEGDFPVSKGLPRGRQPPRRPPRSDEAPSPERPGFSLPDWGLVNPAEPRHSAMPPPLMTIGQRRPSTSSAIGMGLPSPSFASLELDISSSGESLTQAFEEALGKTQLSPGLVGDFFTVDTSSASPTNPTTRVEARKAPPRPAPVTLPPSPKKSTEPRSPAPTQSEFGNTFI